MLFVRAASGHQTLFLAVLLISLLLLWMRAAVPTYALFFGIERFRSMYEILPMLFLTPTGWALLLVGASSAACSPPSRSAVFSAPMMLVERSDAMSAMGISIALTRRNLRVMLAWGAIVKVPVAASALTGFLAFVVVLPLLGHGAWHDCRAIRIVPADTGGDDGEQVFLSPA